jgi:hypothetical protein
VKGRVAEDRIAPACGRRGGGTKRRILLRREVFSALMRGLSCSRQLYAALMSHERTATVVLTLVAVFDGPPLMRGDVLSLPY